LNYVGGVMKTIFSISNKKYILKYERKMPEKEVLKMKSFVTNKGEKLVKTEKFKIKKISEKETERIFEINL
tara:strand:- start:47 stop:259 length:213 start_codon:yes stop_codon:yes gene_type:complete